MVTSSAVVGSSAIRTLGIAGERHGDHGALAHAAARADAGIRWARCSGSGMRTRRSISTALSRALRGREILMQPDRLGDLAPMGSTGLSEVIGSWKIMEMSLPRICAHLRLVEAQQIARRRAARGRRRCGRADPAPGA